MKLSKVKKVVLNHGSLCVARANTGIDVQTWIGCEMALYPVHELVVTPMLAARIWELNEKQIHTLRITEGVAESNQPLLIQPEDLENMAMQAEAEKGEPNLERICQIDNEILLLNKRTGKAYCFSAEYLGPVEGGRVQFFAEDNSNIIAVYSDGKLEAAIYASNWQAMEHMTRKFESIAHIWMEANENA